MVSQITKLNNAIEILILVEQFVGNRLDNLIKNRETKIKFDISQPLYCYVLTVFQEWEVCIDPVCFFN